MNCEEPQNMDELIYFTRRKLEPKGKIMAWASKLECPKCKKALMGKPVEKGKIKIRATEYECPECKYIESKAEHETKLTVCVKYECPHCDNEDTTTTPYKRKTWQGVPAFIFQCGKCNEKIGITKKMKAPKKKKEKKT
ncbi:hypothetical protein K9L97_03980 [Candidatus Woesearchaeota archaeon]|nr:hypothetical protein [Candidatus Woesearchaeota archaeon]